MSITGAIPVTRRVSGWYTKYSPIPQDVIITIRSYPHPAVRNQISLSVKSAAGEPLGVATCALEGWKPARLGQVAIKDWSENEGYYDALVRAGIVGPVEQEWPTGFVKAKICQLSTI